MFLSLLLQAATLLPLDPGLPPANPSAQADLAPTPSESPAAPETEEAKKDYADRLKELTDQPSVDWEQLEAMRPSEDFHHEVLVGFLSKGDRRQAKLAALLAAGTNHARLSHHLYAAACTRKEEATALACLLAPTDLPHPYAPAIAYLAQSRDQPLSIRAAAAGRLLENGYLAVWPLCRSIFRSGTAEDERPAWADWRRGARWELPKRLLLLSVNRWLEQNELTASTIEPNAAWEAQLEQLAATEKLIAQTSAVPEPTKVQASSFRKLFDLAQSGDSQAEWAIQWIRPQFQTLMRVELTSPDLGRQQTARRILSNTPQ